MHPPNPGHEQHSLTHQGRHIPYRLLRGRRKSLALCLDPEEGLLVRAPLGADLVRVQDWVLSKAPWIIEHLDRLARRGLPPPPRTFESGEVYPFQGRELALEVLQGRRGGRARVALLPARLVVVLGQELGEQARAAAVRRALELWYRRQAGLLLPPRVALYAARLGLEPPPVMVRDQKRRWGSCNTRGELRLNWRLVMAPPELYDYVAAHEVCHLLEANHSPRFWELVAGIMPDCRQRRRRLNLLGPHLRL